MKINKYTTLGFMLFLSHLEPTYAACTQEEINTFKRIEDEYNIKYEIDKSTKNYSLYFDRSRQNMYDFTIYTNKQFDCIDISETETQCYPFESGEYEIAVVGQTETCNNVLKTIKLKLPKYNQYSEDALCKGIEEFVLCNPSYDKEIDYETFISRVETYKKTKSEKPIEDELDDNQTKDNEILNTIINYLRDNWIQITIITVFVVLVIITIIVTAKSIRKSRYLE